MANKNHLEILIKGVEFWNSWRKGNNDVPDLSGEDLSKKNLSGINLSGAELSNADFSNCLLSKADFSSANLNGAYFLEANLYKANFSSSNLNNAKLNGAEIDDSDLSNASLIKADLWNANLENANLENAVLLDADLSQAKLMGAIFTNSNLRGANLSLAICVETNFNNADIEGARVYGISAWNTKIEGLKQNNLIITKPTEPVMTLDNINVAQYVNLIRENKNIRDVIGTLAKKSVLILGRFTPERKLILDAIRDKLRQHDFLPMMFDFEKVVSRDFTETIKIMAGMSMFVIADITNPKSAPLELQALVPDYKIPFLPIIEEGEEPFSMFIDLGQKYNWVLPIMSYPNKDAIIKGFKKGILDKALIAHNKLMVERQRSSPAIENIADYED